MKFMYYLFFWSVFIPLMTISSSLYLYGQDTESVGIDEQLGKVISIELPLVNSNGHEITLKEIMSSEKPIILVPVYYECPMLCGLVLQGIVKGLKTLSWDVGNEFQVVVVSIDPDEGEFLALEKKNNVLAEYGERGSRDGWYFLTDSSANLQTIMDEVGFQYYYNDETEEYVHAAGIMFLSPKGKIARYLYGVHFSSIDIQNALFEAADGNVGTTLEKAILYCYSYDENSKTYVSMAWNVMKIGGTITLGIVVLLIGYLWYNQSYKSEKNQTRS